MANHVERFEEINFTGEIKALGMVKGNNFSSLKIRLMASFMVV